MVWIYNSFLFRVAFRCGMFFPDPKVICDSYFNVLLIFCACLRIPLLCQCLHSWSSTPAGLQRSAAPLALTMRSTTTTAVVWWVSIMFIGNIMTYFTISLENFPTHCHWVIRASGVKTEKKAAQLAMTSAGTYTVYSLTQQNTPVL